MTALPYLPLLIMFFSADTFYKDYLNLQRRNMFSSELESNSIPPFWDVWIDRTNGFLTCLSEASVHRLIYEFW